MRPARLRTVLLAVLSCVTLHAGGAAVETEPAVRLTPDPPRAGATLAVTLADDLLAPGRILRIEDSDRGSVLAERVLGRYGVDGFRFALPVDLTHLVVVLTDGPVELLRWPATGALPVSPPEATARGPGPAPASTADSDERPDCTTLAPADEAQDALRAWVQACPLDSVLLRDRDLSGIRLAGRDLHRADLSGSDLSDADLSGADLGGAVLLGARLDGATLAGANLEIADLGHVSAFVTDFAGARMRGADLRGATLSDASFANADLGDARISGASLRGVDFTGATCPDGTRTLSSCDGHLVLP